MKIAPTTGTPPLQYAIDTPHRGIHARKFEVPSINWVYAPKTIAFVSAFFLAKDIIVWKRFKDFLADHLFDGAVSLRGMIVSAFEFDGQ
jgi:hypothetical protein